MDQLDILTEDPRWASLDLEALAAAAIGAALAHLGLPAHAAEITLLACNDTRIADLNAEFRDKPAPTNVLSWPAEERGAETAGDLPVPVVADPDGTLPLGDVALAYDTCLREAEAAGKPMRDHVTHLIVHGTLHLLGYDHIRDPDATLMERLEGEILGKLGLDDPYIEDMADDASA